MKYFLLVCINCVFICTGCVSTYFKTPNDLYKEPATVYLNDGTVKGGELTIQLETEFTSANSVTLVDKDYVTAKEFKKVVASTDHPCVETGKAEECCEKMGTSHNERIYHVML